MPGLSFNFAYSLKGLRNNAQVSKGKIPVHLTLDCHFNSKKKKCPHGKVYTPIRKASEASAVDFTDRLN